MSTQAFIAGIGSRSFSDGDASSFLQMARSDKYDFVTICLPHSNDITRRDVIDMTSSWWSTSVVGIVADPPHLRQLSSEDNQMEIMRDQDPKTAYNPLLGTRLVEQLVSTSPKEAETYISYMLDWAGHMNIPAVILPSIPDALESAVQYARVVSSWAWKASARNIQLWIRTPCTSKALESFSLLHKRCDSVSNIGMMLYFNSDDSSSIHQLLTLTHVAVGCNLRAVSYNQSVFLANKRGFPVLSKMNQLLFTELLKRLGRTLRILVEGDSSDSLKISTKNTDEHGKTGYMAYLQYLQYLRKKEDVVAILDSNESRMENNYLDHLQSALQPLADDLEFSTYETFERDPVKYVNYQKAIELVLLDGLQCKWFHEQKEFEFVCVTIIVVGAGRGPLIQASLDAVDEVNSLLRRLNAAETIQVKVIAVEKNSCAVSYLRSYLSTQPRWQSSVSIVQCDIRFAQQDLFLSKIIHGTHNHKADIVVSELLGSFGDNELSPECLDGVQRSGLLKNTCVSIPQSYTSYLAPLTSMRLHAEAQAQAFLPSDQSSGPLGKPCGILQAMETPYVVRPHAASQIHDEKPCWTFHHFHSNVNKDAEDNVRYSQVTFSPDANLGRQCGSGYGSLADLSLLNLALDSTHNEYDLYIHGFLGTFSCVLYRSLRDSQISTICTAPNLFTSGMFSWFPLFFPLRESMLVPVNSTIACNIWRRTETETSADRGRVWYEWCADVRKKDGKIISSSVLHNPNGRSSHVRL